MIQSSLASWVLEELSLLAIGRGHIALLIASQGSTSAPVEREVGAVVIVDLLWLLTLKNCVGFTTTILGLAARCLLS